jgi:hypothetical protein
MRRRAHGHVDVPEGWGPAPDLASWLAQARAQWGSGELLPSQAAQVGVLGVAPPQ